MEIRSLIHRRNHFPAERSAAKSQPAPNLRVNFFSQLSRQHFSIDFTSDSIFLSFGTTSDSEREKLVLTFLSTTFFILLRAVSLQIERNDRKQINDAVCWNFGMEHR